MREGDDHGSFRPNLLIILINSLSSSPLSSHHNHHHQHHQRQQFKAKATSDVGGQASKRERESRDEHLQAMEQVVRDHARLLRGAAASLHRRPGITEHKQTIERTTTIV